MRLNLQRFRIKWIKTTLFQRFIFIKNYTTELKMR